MSFFKKKNKKKEELDASFEKVLTEISRIDEWDDPKKISHYILESCEQIIALTKQILAQKAEEETLTGYLLDIRTIKGLEGSKKDDLYIVAKNIEDLDKARKNYEGSSPPLTDEQFMMLSEDEERIPDVIKRMQDNESYQFKEEKNMRALEAEKSEYEIERDQILSANRLIKRVTLLMAVTFMSFLILFFILRQNVNIDISSYLLVLLFATAMGIFIIFLRLSHNSKRSRKLLRSMNKTISVLNVVRMKYANVPRAINYEQEKYGITTAAELSYMWDRYMEMVKARAQYEKDNDGAAYLGGSGTSMIPVSEKTEAIIDEEVSEIINSCYAKAQKILEENKDILESMKDALLKYETIDALQIDDLLARRPVRAPTVDYDPAKEKQDGSQGGSGASGAADSEKSSDSKPSENSASADPKTAAETSASGSADASAERGSDSVTEDKITQSEQKDNSDKD